MQLTPIPTGTFTLDGGAMFGVVPKPLWNKVQPADPTSNLCTWAMRCLLVQTPAGDNILIDSGMGTKQDAKWQSHYHPTGPSLEESLLANAGLKPEDITHHILTHLHFDHCGGSINRLDNGDLVPTFPNAIYYVSEAQWQLTKAPNRRERASFLLENIEPMTKAKELILVDTESTLLPGISVQFFDGHTDGMMLPHITLDNGRILIYCADLLPSQWHIPIAWTMAYDVRPLLSMEEKESFLNKASATDSILFLEHDHIAECCTVKEGTKSTILNLAGTLKDELEKTSGHD